MRRCERPGAAGPGGAAPRGISCGLASPGRPGSPWDGQGQPLGDALSGRPGSQQRGSAGVRGRRGAAEERADPRAGRGAAEDPERGDAAAPGRKGRRRRARGGGAPRSRGAVRGCSWPLEAQGWPRTRRRPTKPLRAERDGSARVRVRARSDSAGGAGGSSDPSAQSAVQWRARPRCPRPPASAAEHAHAAPSLPQRAQYQDKLARQRYEDQLKQQVSLAPARQGRRRDPQEPHVVQAGCAARPLPRCCAAEAGGYRPPGAPSWDPTGDLAVTGLWGGGGSDVSACHEHYSF